MSEPDWASIATSVFAGASALVAACSIIFAKRMQHSQEILHQATLSLEWAYNSLTEYGTKVHPPPADRLNWLTAARHIERYKQLKAQLAFEVHRTICEEQEENCRYRLHKCLDAPELLAVSYYNGEQDADKAQKIDLKSALVIHDFSKWREGREDPLDKVDTNAILKRSDALKGNYGLSCYVNTTLENRTR